MSSTSGSVVATGFVVVVVAPSSGGGTVRGGTDVVGMVVVGAVVVEGVVVVDGFMAVVDVVVSGGVDSAVSFPLHPPANTTSATRSDAPRYRLLFCAGPIALPLRSIDSGAVSRRVSRPRDASTEGFLCGRHRHWVAEGGEAMTCCVQTNTLRSSDASTI